MSVVIPTRNRSASLMKLMFSILSQRRLPNEVLVVDDSDNDETSRVITEKGDIFWSKGILLRYLHGNKENRSISAARNLGVMKSTGEIIFFLDDDVILDNKYIEEIMKTFEQYPTAKGVQGYITEGYTLPNLRSLLLNSINKVFFLDHVEKNKCAYRLGLTYPYFPENVIQCQWLHGSNMSLKKEVFQSFRFDEKLKGRSIGEDVDFTYRIYKHYPNSLFMNPRAKLIHRNPAEKSERDPFVTQFLIYSGMAYSVYLFVKNHEQTVWNRLLFLWKQLGNLVEDCSLYLLVFRDVKSIFWSIESCIFVADHLKEVKSGDFRFLYSMIKRRRCTHKCSA
jgi:glycosyltransferase involved in cell wall biosynthesis